MNDDINLLPLAFRQRDLFRTRLRQWSAVWTATLLLGVSGGAWKYAGGQSLRERVRSLEEQCVPMRELAQQNQTLQTQLHEFTGRQSLLAELEQAQRPVQLLGIISQSALATDKRLHVEQLQLTQEEVPVAPPTTPPANVAKPTNDKPVRPVIRTRLVLTGLATDDLAVARFIAQLRGVAVFHSVDLESSSRVAHPTGHAQHYEVHCVY
ncbi:MAG: hypothetical protein SH850_12855 [Planctomycetaceae bacterium]|nr:hypothetical protein [Planctomycetaceae bacterium]